MKILHIAPLAPYNKGWGYQENLLPKYQAKLGHDVYVIVSNFENSKNGKIDVGEEKFDYENVHIIRKKAKSKLIGKLTESLNTIKIYSIICTINPDLIMVHGLDHLNFRQIVKYKKNINNNCKIICDNHLDYNNANINRSLKVKLLKRFYRMIAQKYMNYIDKYYGVTPWRCEYLEKVYGIDKSKIDLLIMGADDEKINFDKKLEIRNNLRQKYDISDGEFVICTGGKVDENKKIDLIMDAVKDFDNVKLLIIGEPMADYKTNFDKHLNSNVILAGWINGDKAYDYFLASDLVVFPGTHSVLWEQACACGIPIIVKKWAGMHHVDCNSNCIFLEKDSCDEIQQVIRNILFDKDKYNKMVETANTSKEKFFYSKIAQKVINDCKN